MYVALCGRGRELGSDIHPAGPMATQSHIHSTTCKQLATFVPVKGLGLIFLLVGYLHRIRDTHEHSEQI